jgi:hypothetical protein
MTVDWAGIAALGERRVLDALAMALNGKSIPDIESETGIPAASLYSIRKHGPFAHKKQGKAKGKTTSSA